MKIVILHYTTREVHIFDLPLTFKSYPELFVLSQCSQDGKTFTTEETDFMVVELKKNEGRVPLYIH